MSISGVFDPGGWVVVYFYSFACVLLGPSEGVFSRFSGYGAYTQTSKNKHTQKTHRRTARLWTYFDSNNTIEGRKNSLCSPTNTLFA